MHHGDSFMPVHVTFREVRGGRGKRGQTGGAVGGSDGGEERSAGSGPWQWNPRGPGALVRT